MIKILDLVFNNSHTHTHAHTHTHDVEGLDFNRCVYNTVEKVKPLKYAITKKIFIASYYRQLSTNIKVNNYYNFLLAPRGRRPKLI